MIQMTKDDCTICDGSGWVNPYPYRKRKKCSHRWSRGSFMERFYSAAKEVERTTDIFHRWEKALETEIKEEETK